MDPVSYGPGTDPAPFIAAAYGIGTVVLVGIVVWLIIERKRLRAHLAAVNVSRR
jgi:heme exporter protein CcmD